MVNKYSKDLDYNYLEATKEEEEELFNDAEVDKIRQ